MAAQARRVRSSFSISAKRTYPSPPGPNPTPGETATRARSSSSDANFTEPRPAAWGGRGAHTNIDATGSGTCQPTASSSVQSSFARCLYTARFSATSPSHDDSAVDAASCTGAKLP